MHCCYSASEDLLGLTNNKTRGKIAKAISLFEQAKTV